MLELLNLYRFSDTSPTKPGTSFTLDYIFTNALKRNLTVSGKKFYLDVQSFGIRGNIKVQSIKFIAQYIIEI